MDVKIRLSEERKTQNMHTSDGMVENESEILVHIGKNCVILINVNCNTTSQLSHITYVRFIR